MQTQFKNWTRAKATAPDGREFDAYATSVWGRTIAVEACIVDILHPDHQEHFLERERIRVLAIQPE